MGWTDDDENKSEPRVTTKSQQVIVLSNKSSGKYFIGVQPSPVDDVLKAQLGIDGGLVVESVVKDSPAAKAGVQQHDILLKFGDTELKTIANLQEAVESNKDKEARLKYLRKSSEKTASITPSARPDGLIGRIPLEGDAQGVINIITEGTDDPRSLILKRMPGAIDLGSGWKGFPKELSIQINKDSDKPARVTVKHKDKTWEFSADQAGKLHELPEEIRDAVAGLMHGGRGPFVFHAAPGGLRHGLKMGQGGPGAQAFGFGFDLSDKDVGNIEKKIEEAMKKIPAEHASRVREHLEKAMKELGQARSAKEKTSDTASEIRELREAVEQLKKEIRERK